jgi:hypothetical protein
MIANPSRSTASVIDQSFLLVHVDGRQRGGAPERVAAVGEPAHEHLVAEVASAPPLVKKKVSMSPGVMAASRAPSRARTSVAMKGLA